MAISVDIGNFKVEKMHQVLSPFKVIINKYRFYHVLSTAEYFPCLEIHCLDHELLAFGRLVPSFISTSFLEYSTYSNSAPIMNAQQK